MMEVRNFSDCSDYARNDACHETRQGLGRWMPMNTTTDAVTPPPAEAATLVSPRRARIDSAHSTAGDQPATLIADKDLYLVCGLISLILALLVGWYKRLRHSPGKIVVEPVPL